MNKLPNDVKRIIIDLELRDRIERWIKKKILYILTSHIHWRPYGVEKNKYQNCETLDDYITQVSEDIYQDIVLKNICKSPQCQNYTYIGNYIPCVGTMDGDESSSFYEDFYTVVALGTGTCNECTEYLKRANPRSQNNVT